MRNFAALRPGTCCKVGIRARVTASYHPVRDAFSALDAHASERDASDVVILDKKTHACLPVFLPVYFSTFAQRLYKCLDGPSRGGRNF